jgi:hypothetical protein
VIGLEAPDACAPPGDAVTVYEVIGEPPVEAGGEKLTVAVPLPGVADTPVGAPGADAATTPVTADIALVDPPAFVAVTTTRTVMPRSASTSV